MKKLFYKWIVFQNNEVVNYGIENTFIEIFVERIFPRANSTADRDLSDMQEYANVNLPNENYLFMYEEIEIDFSDIIKRKWSEK